MLANRRGLEGRNIGQEARSLREKTLARSHESG